MNDFCGSSVRNMQNMTTGSSAEHVVLGEALGRPLGTWGHRAMRPSVETLGYSRMSLRDKERRPGIGTSDRHWGLPRGIGNFREALVLRPPYGYEG